MKLKLKNIKFKELFLAHVEKGVLALACVCLVLFIISAVGRETLPPEKEPDQLTAQTTNARNHVETSDPEKDLEAIQPPDRIPYYTRVDREPVELDNYATKIPFNAPILESKTPREEPIYFTVRDLQVGTGFAPFAIVDRTKVAAEHLPGIRKRNREEVTAEAPVEMLVDNGIPRGGVKVGRDDKLVVKYWATVTGLIPIRDQKAEYYKAFENAVNFEPDQDLPRYLGYQVERAEVTSGDLDNLNWGPIKADVRFMSEWSTEYNEPVVAECVTPMFAQPLAPRVGSDWEEYVGHPKIPMEPKRGMPGHMRGPGGIEGMPGGMDELEGRFPAGGQAHGGAFGEAEEGEDENMPFERATPRGKRVVQQEDPAEVRKRQEVVGVVGQKSIKGVDNLLFRFCDFTVEPGKQYAYRVRLGISNPNRGVPVKFLKRPELADAKPRITPWSDASPIATIPYGDKLLAGNVVPTASSIKEPEVSIRIVQINDELGAEVPFEKLVSRGTMANFKQVEFRYRKEPEHIAAKAVGDFITNAMILDMRGGQPIFGPREKEITQPGEVLVLNRKGELVAMNEFDGEDAWYACVPPEKEKVERPMEGIEGMPGGPGMDGIDQPLPGKSKKPPKAIRGGSDQVDILRQPPAQRPKRGSGSR